MIRDVAVVVYDGVEPFELGVFCEVWGFDRRSQGLPGFEFAICTPVPGRVTTSYGVDLDVRHGLERVQTADLVCVPAMTRDVAPPEPLLDALRAAHARGARLLSACSGAFVLGAAGLLDGRRCTTHWAHADTLAASFPKAFVDPDVLYVDDDPILTGAGSAAGIDACLHLLRKDYGAQVAAAVARRMVVPPQRDGGQAQYVRSALPESTGDTLTGVLGWMAEHLDEELTVDALAGRAAMSPRTFARRFRDETGTTPHQWLTHQRVLRAEQLLEETSLPIEAVARHSGFGNPAALRHHFGRARGTTPAGYRRTFGCAPAPA